MNTTYEIKTLNPAPLMTQTSVFFTGTYQQAVDAARTIFAACKRNTSVYTTKSTTAWFIIRDGKEVDNNTNSGVVLNNK